MEYAPSKFVITPVLVPLIKTFAPGIGPFASETTPETVD